MESEASRLYRRVMRQQRIQEDPNYLATVNDRDQKSRRKRRQDPTYVKRVNTYQREWYREKVRTAPEYLERRNRRKRELRRKKRVQDPQWIANQVARMMKTCETCLAKRRKHKHREARRKQLPYSNLNPARRRKAQMQQQRRNTQELADPYIRKKLRRIVPIDTENTPDSLIRLKRAQLILGREIRKGIENETCQ